MQHMDERGWKYRVMSGLGDPPVFKARYQKPDKHGETGWHGVAAVPWRGTEAEAQADLDQLAEKKGWKRYEY